MESLYKDCDLIFNNDRAYFHLPTAKDNNFTQTLINKNAIEITILPKLFGTREIDEDYEECLERLRRISQTDVYSLERFCMMPEFVDLLTWLISLNGTEHTNLSVDATIVMTNALFIISDSKIFKSDTLFEHIFYVLQNDYHDYKEYVTNLVLNYLSPETYQDLINNNIINILLQFFNTPANTPSNQRCCSLSFLVFCSLFHLMNEDQYQLLLPTFEFAIHYFLDKHFPARLNAARYLSEIFRNDNLFDTIVQGSNFYDDIAYAGYGFPILSEQIVNATCDIFITFIKKGYTDFTGIFRSFFECQFNSLMKNFDKFLEFLYYAIPYNLQDFEESKLYNFVVRKFNNGTVTEKQAASKVLIQYMCLHSQEIDLQIGEFVMPDLADMLEDFYPEALLDILKLFVTIFQRGEKFIQLGINSNIPEIVLELSKDAENDDKIIDICNQILRIFNIDPDDTF
ncbi:hypothetical protein TVAG_491700 [Trichomonas vaginalis G3]|uniref:Uncharacterized protein n=1 Tax=Trichomonas vaginalis (strain ATCC PRA-98 / G3) TaxID=412133 RepID=A2EAK1_TRIV3|nr:armadillo (ARM) repeat-containing protein family [Trichomonas vaginalis G3]EAY10312.1 hypothetical protein TVAG_491700 [Trichomonas vaginalis G3]KAI5491029.1 armadillo (ARM) repeat-containing protein family [Trichomonas vaginalis G3]|eukprot:XP_001322535.1 hypothetical protein [Trichomonas vaginalis G3]